MSKLLELLRAGQVDTFNAQRGSRVTLDFFAADLAGLDLSGADLSKVILEKADLSGCTLRAANLSGADLSGADLSGACLDEVIAIRAKFRDAYLGDVEAPDAQLSGADFTEADLTGANLAGANLAGARMKRVVLERATLTQADMSEARIEGANLKGASMGEAILARAEGARVDAAGAQLQGADLNGAQLSQINLTGADLTGADLTGADLSGANLTGAVLTDANLARVDFFDATLDAAHAHVREAAGAVQGFEDGGALHVDDPTVAVSGNAIAAAWDNAEDDGTFCLRVAVREGARARAWAIDVPVDQVLARYVLPAGGGRFHVLVLVERPTGADVVWLDTDINSMRAPVVARLGYHPEVKPVVTRESAGSLRLHGISRNGQLVVQRWEAGVLTELYRAAGQTFRGFCGRHDAVLLSKGGTVLPVGSEGLGAMQTAPAGFPGNATAGALAADGAAIALAWTPKTEKGLRLSLPGLPELAALDPKADVATVDIASDTTFGEQRWLVAWTRTTKQQVTTSAWAASMPDGNPFRLHDDASVDITDVRFAVSDGFPCIALLTADEEVLVVRMTATGPKPLGRIGDTATSGATSA